MFRDFSFDAVSPPSFEAYEADRAAMNVSPSSKPETRQHYLTRPPPPPCTIGDLASQLNQQDLCIDHSARDGPPTLPNDEDSAPEAPRPTYSRVSASLLRMQRQSNSRMTCSSSHVRDISRLVQMIETEEQCTVADDTSRASSTSAASSSAAGDEGVDMEYDVPREGIDVMAGMPQWRADGIRESCIRVTKPVRMRRRAGVRVEKRRAT
jgi:hypothetical protein